MKSIIQSRFEMNPLLDLTISEVIGVIYSNIDQSSEGHEDMQYPPPQVWVIYREDILYY